ncbi:MAG: hypothetical protein HN742_18420 [Lentisphaerae bacterium]|jgi:hypothetical protein|nr:hypothetical protein [Lentisphaerota bacterium]MBT4818100.1 hypothetical protein [Lentisphaerota bacterium]MBT5606792.1 hypothetical protein [Lentisphaerota bacterium]MBT7061588.1 hypothetical protein [Lentisphaerota bacterium]MBT7843861.1 hypothetical protein [Lentisphaerota bacterium]
MIGLNTTQRHGPQPALRSSGSSIRHLEADFELHYYGIEFYSAGRRHGPSLAFSRTGLLTSYGFFDHAQRPHGPFAAYDEVGELRHLKWFKEGRQCPTPTPHRVRAVTGKRDTVPAGDSLPQR